MASHSDASRDVNSGASADRLPADSFAAPDGPPAQALDGTYVAAQEIEAAAELSRVARRLGLTRAGLNGFHLYGAFIRLRGAVAATERALSRLPRRSKPR